MALMNHELGNRDFYVLVESRGKYFLASFHKRDLYKNEAGGLVINPDAVPMGVQEIGGDIISVPKQVLKRIELFPKNNPQYLRLR